MLHYGHINLLRRAKERGDYLIVALSTDEFNQNSKQKKTYFSFEKRKQLLEAIRYVDLVIPEQSWDQKVNDINLYQVDEFVIGDDWQGQFDFIGDQTLNDELNFSVYADNVIYSWNKPEQGTLSETMRKDPDFLSDRRKQDARIIKMMAEAKSKNDVVKAGILNKTVKGIGFNAFLTRLMMI